MPEKILIVEDSPAMRQSLMRLLGEEAYEVAEAADGQEGLEQYARFNPDLVILDINMPRMNGLETLRRLRQFSGVPVLILSVRNSAGEKAFGLDAGADDFLAKPFGVDELLARVRALLRRPALRGKMAEGPQVVRLGGGELTIDLDQRRVLLRGQEVPLTPVEARLLFTLAERPGITITRDDLLTSVWGGEGSGTVQNLKLYILYLRRKIEPDPANPRYLISVRGSGYRLASV